MPDLLITADSKDATCGKCLYLGMIYHPAAADHAPRRECKAFPHMSVDAVRGTSDWLRSAACLEAERREKETRR